MSLAALVATAAAAIAPTPEAPIVVDGKPISRGHLRHWAGIAARVSGPRRAGYRRFLRESGQTPRDIRTRVALDLQADRLRAHATAGIEDLEEQQEALEAFILEFRRKWSARTSCRKPWVTADCGRVVHRG